ncbi:polyprotein [Phytophthora megakarya]|uniref:Polyprotein n=1 Tax=Phytophthora megakarya TaxID=4795 RepID=A0A225WES7_9STRA|nr:polyprotein [Phytophthora megakarya]
MEIEHDKDVGTLMIKQSGYIDGVAERFGHWDPKGVDNPCATNLKMSKAQSPRTDADRHVDIRNHIIRENSKDGTVKIRYIDTKHQLPDMLTEALGTKTLQNLRNASGIKANVT